MEAFPCLTLASRVWSQFALLPSTRSTRGLGGRTAYGIPAHGHVVAAQVECGAKEASPSSGGLVQSSIIPYRCCSTLPWPGDMWGVVTPCHTTTILFPLEGPIGSLHRVWSHIVPFGASPPGTSEAEQQHRHTSTWAHGCGTGGVWVRGGFTQQ